jgi:CIC family chloride channel protein
MAVPSEALSALLGMTAFFAASVRAPFTGVVLLAEMTNGFDLLLPLMSSASVGYFVSELAGIKPIYERLRELSFPGAREVERASS